MGLKDKKFWQSMRKTSILWICLSTGTDYPEWLWSLLLWRHPKDCMDIILCNVLYGTLLEQRGWTVRPSEFSSSLNHSLMWFSSCHKLGFLSLWWLKCEKRSKMRHARKHLFRRHKVTVRLMWRWTKCSKHQANKIFPCIFSPLLVKRTSNSAPGKM